MNKKQNIRQIEMGERLDEMLNLACEIQRDNGNKPIPKERFLAIFRIKHKVGTYASRRYFEDYITSEIFEYITNSKGAFKVNQKTFEEWRKNNTVN